MNKAEMLKGLVLNGIMKPNEARAKLDLAPVPGVADELVSQSQIQPMEQTAQMAQDANTRENDLADAQVDAAQNPPKETKPKEDDDEDKPAPQKSVDMEALQMMLKGVFTK
jgi:hypothetical protein